MDTNEARSVVASIKPKYVKLIRAGQKKYELRKRRIGPAGTLVAVYETLPVGLITGRFTIGSVITGSPLEIWENLSDCLGVSFDEFGKYFGSGNRAFAHEILEYTELSQPLTIAQIGIGTNAPQSWQRLRPDQMSQLVSSPA